MTLEEEAEEIIKRLRELHWNLCQDAFYTTEEHPLWDCTEEAVGFIDKLINLRANTSTMMRRNSYHTWLMVSAMERDCGI